MYDKYPKYIQLYARKGSMNTSFLTIRMVLIMSFFSTQQTCGMQWVCQLFYGKPTQEKQEKKFECFSRLPKDLQLLIIGYSVRDANRKTNLQYVNRHWSEVVSIKYPRIFEACCNIERLQMSRIFLNAVYNSNYDGVENILKNSCLSKIESKNLCYRNVDNNEMGYETVLDPYYIAREDKQMIDLLEKYRVTTLSSNSQKVMCQPTPLIMACLAGNSDAINHDIRGNKVNIRRAFNIVVACDYEKCMQQLMHNLSDEFEELFSRDEERLVLGRKLLRRACVYNSCKVLTILLNNRFCDKNNIYEGATILDEILRADRINFAPLIALLKKYGAKTAEQILDENTAVDEENEHLYICAVLT
jgi:hypothetical protein